MDTSGKKILLVEDEVLIAMSEKMTLEKYGYIVEHAKTGESAVELAFKSSYDLILMDINLGPGIDGPEASRQILDKAEIPIVFLSSHTDEKTIRKTEDITSYGYVLKGSGEVVLQASIKMAFRLFKEKQAKKRANRLLEKTSKNIPGMIYQYQMFFDGTSCFPFSTEKIWEIYEVTPEDVIEDASLVYKRIHPEDYNEVVKSIQKSYEEMSSWQCDYRVSLPTQGEKWMRGIANPELLDDSVLWHGYITDITERKKHEEKLKSLTAAVEQSPAGIVITDSNGTIQYVNEKITETTKYPENELIGMNPSVFKSGEQNDAFYENLWSTVLSGETWSGEMLNKKKDGEKYWEHAIISPVKDINGNISKIIGMKEDITNLKEHQKSTETLLREVHHRVKNNFSAIEAMLSLELSKTESEEAQHSLIDAKGRVSSMRVVYDKLLESNNYDVISIKDYFENFIEAIVAVFQNGSGITVEKDIEDFDLSSKYVFPLGVIVNEFITNSMKYAFKGLEKGTVSLAIQKESKFVKVRLKDNGHGIPDNIISEDSDSFGMLLIHSMCKQMKSDYSMANNKGLELKLTFEL